MVAKHKSISKVSEEIHRKQPAITKQIKTLEEKYGVQLFERNIKKGPN
jgi:DNA-binding transcriptional LysR family regulator